MHCKALSVNFVFRPDYGSGAMHWCRCICHWNLQTVCLQVTTPSRRRTLTMSDVDAPFSRSTLMRCLLYVDKRGRGGIVRGRRRPSLSENDTRCRLDWRVKTHCCLLDGRTYIPADARVGVLQRRGAGIPKRGVGIPKRGAGVEFQLGASWSSSGIPTGAQS